MGFLSALFGSDFLGIVFFANAFFPSTKNAFVENSLLKSVVVVWSIIKNLIIIQSKSEEIVVAFIMQMQEGSVGIL